MEDKEINDEIESCNKKIKDLQFIVLIQGIAICLLAMVKILTLLFE
jgi:hypothetical protein